MTCDDFLEDPEACRAHAEDCESCRRLQKDLDMLQGGLDAPMLDTGVEKLPLAPWEEAAHRPWRAVIAVGIALLTVASILFLVVGVSPITGFGKAVRSTISSVLPLRLLLVAGSRIREAPLQFQVAVGAGFVLVNFLLYFLLKRPARGYDAS